MLKYIIVLALSACACDLVGDAKNACQKLLDDETPKIEDQIWQRCTDYYQNVVVPQIQADFTKAESDVEAALAATCCQRIQAFGCTAIPTTASEWTCAQAPTCQ